jgi:hypothetical protein
VSPAPEQCEALRDASDVLRTEANELASYLEHTLKVELTLRDQKVLRIDDMTPHRVVIAVHNEMRRLRKVSDTLLGMVPRTPNEEDEEP